MNGVTPFITSRKAVKDIVAGDVIVDERFGARYVTRVFIDPNGDFVLFFDLPRLIEDHLEWVVNVGDFRKVFVVDRRLGESEMITILGVITLPHDQGPNQ